MKEVIKNILNVVIGQLQLCVTNIKRYRFLEPKRYIIIFKTQSPLQPNKLPRTRNRRNIRRKIIDMC